MQDACHLRRDDRIRKQETSAPVRYSLLSTTLVKCAGGEKGCAHQDTWRQKLKGTEREVERAGLVIAMEPALLLQSSVPQSCVCTFTRYPARPAAQPCRSHSVLLRS